MHFCLCFSCRILLYFLGDQIVISVANDFDPGKLAQRQFPADIEPPVNVRSIGFGCQSLAMAMNYGRVSGEFHTRFDAQVFGDALDDNAQVPRGRVAVAVEHPV
jgi:hypothetical protein